VGKVATSVTSLDVNDLNGNILATQAATTGNIWETGRLRMKEDEKIGL
jgi:hypothetical protein